MADATDATDANGVLCQEKSQVLLCDDFHGVGSEVLLNRSSILFSTLNMLRKAEQPVSPVQNILPRSVAWVNLILIVDPSVPGGDEISW